MMEIPKPPIPQINQPSASLTELATAGQRFGNMFLDGLAVYLIEIVLAYFFYRWISINPLVGNLLVYLLYYIGLESLNGKTLGKYITRTKVLNRDGSEADFGRIFLRTIIRYVPFDSFSFLFYGARPTGWHDRWSGTVVIHDK